MTGGLDGLEAQFDAHKLPILGTAAAAVVAFALYKRKTGAASTPAPAQGITTTPGTYSAGGQLVGANGAAAYDSSSSDVYGLIQPQLESLGSQLTTLQQMQTTVPVSTAPPVTPTTNEQWESQAMQGWGAAGGNALDMQAGLTQYLAGQAINSAQANGVNWATQHYGAAPQLPTKTSPIVPV